MDVYSVYSSWFMNGHVTDEFTEKKEVLNNDALKTIKMKFLGIYKKVALNIFLSW